MDLRKPEVGPIAVAFARNSDVFSDAFVAKNVTESLIYDFRTYESPEEVAEMPVASSKS